MERRAPPCLRPPGPNPPRLPHPTPHPPPAQLDDIKSFRQWDSSTPGHPENFLTPGVEVTTGARAHAGRRGAVGPGTGGCSRGGRFPGPPGGDLALCDTSRPAWPLTPRPPPPRSRPPPSQPPGPLGQGICNAVGLAVAEAHLAQRFNKPDAKVVDHYT
jgi:hypothetical protein